MKNPTRRNLLEALGFAAAASAFKPIVANAFSSQPANYIISELELLDHTANGGRFLLFGEPHVNNPDSPSLTEPVLAMQAMAQAMPALACSGVTVVGLEIPVQLNPTIERIVEYSRNGLSRIAMISELEAGVRTFTATLPNSPFQLSRVQQEDFIDVIHSAAQNGIKPIGIDVRWQSREFVDRFNQIDAGDMEKIEAQQYVYRSLQEIIFLNDQATARFAASQLNNHGPNARMAIIYGERHLVMGAMPGSNRVSTLGQEILRYGTATFFTVKRDRNTVSVQESEKGASLQRVNDPYQFTRQPDATLLANDFILSRSQELDRRNTLSEETPRHHRRMGARSLGRPVILARLRF